MDATRAETHPTVARTDIDKIARAAGVRLNPEVNPARAFFPPESLALKIHERLMGSEFATEKTRIGDQYITGLTCPACGEKEAWAYADKPFSIICNRANNCGVRTKTLDLFPDVLKRVERDYPSTDADPHRPAREYLGGRRLSKSLEGLVFRYVSKTRRGCEGGVGFALGALGADGKLVVSSNPPLNIRIFDPPPGEGKTHNAGHLESYYWAHPGKQYDLTKPIYITEGVIDALALWEMGIQAIAVIFSGRDPEKVPLPPTMRIVLAFDNDAAGRSAFLRWKKCYPHAEVLTPPSDEGDWNDVLISHEEEAGDYLSKNETRFRQEAEILSAPDAPTYAELFHRYRNRQAGLFEFEGATYFATGGYCNEVGHFTVDVDHFRLDKNNADQYQYLYRLRVHPKGGTPTTFTATGSELAGPDGLVRLFLDHAKVLWKGTRPACLELVQKIVSSSAPTVRQISAAGYDAESQCYIFRDFMINRAGEKVLPDKNGFFALSARKAMRLAELQLGILTPTEGISARDIVLALHAAWGVKAVVAVAFTVATWFVTKIKQQLHFFPFLSFFGDPAAGKTFLITAINALQCLDEEGISMTKDNTSKGEIRALSQVSGLFRALLEANQEKAVRFDFGKILTMYNESPFQLRAEYSNDNQTRLMRWKGGLVFVQNSEPFRTAAQKGRVVSMKFLEADIADTKEAFDCVQAMKKEHLAHFFVEVMRARQRFESEWLERYQRFDQELECEIPFPRVRQNTALLLAFFSILREVVGLDLDIQAYLIKIAKIKIESCRHHAETLADYFFDTLDQLSPEDREQCIALDDDGRMQVLLPVAIRLLREKEIWSTPNVSQLQESLREHPAYLNSRHSTRKFPGGNGSAIKHAWLFDPKKIAPQDAGDAEGATDGEEGEDGISEDLRGAPLD